MGRPVVHFELMSKDPARVSEFYAKVFFLETLSAGPEAVASQRQCRADFALSLRRWHESARRAHSAWPAATALAYEAATGAVHEITLGRDGESNTTLLCAAATGTRPQLFSPDGSKLVLTDSTDTRLIDLSGTHAATSMMAGVLLAWRS